MKRVYAFRHEPSVDLGYVRTAVESRQVQLETIDLYRGDSVPEVRPDDGLIFMGGSMSVNDGLPWLETEIALIREAVGRGQPVFGVCLGGQMIAKALGVPVRPSPTPEIGWFEIDLAPGAAADPLFGGLASPLPVFQWHNETFALPRGACLLATSAGGQIPQAFRVGQSTYGIQFHPEVTPELIRLWSKDHSHPIDSSRQTQHLTAISHYLFGGWANLF